MSAAGAIFRLR